MPADRSVPEITVTLAGRDYPIHMGEITARQVLTVRTAFGLSPRAFPVLIQAGAIDVVEVAAMIWLSRQQTGEDVSTDEVLDSLTLGQDVTITAPSLLDEESVPDLDPKA